MIANERQYRLTRTAARALEEALARLETVMAYRRIAVGLTQKGLAERLGLKEQQVQRYEATQYAGVSLERIQAVAEALEVEIHERVILPAASGQ